jgi:hypothetical protein
MLGIGLGGFARGVDDGVGIARKMRGTPEEQAQRLARNTADEAKVEFDAQGGGSMEQFQRYLAPKVAAKFIQAGDLDRATKWTEWTKNEDNRLATRAFGEGMIAAQTGDIGGALTKFVQAGRTKGYGADYKIGDPEKLPDGGWRVSIDANGKQLSKEFRSPDEVLKFGSTYLNPETAFLGWQKQQDEERKSAAEVKTYAAKKGVDLGYEKDKQAAGLGPSNYEVYHETVTGPDGKPVSRPVAFDKRSATKKPIEADGPLTRPGRDGQGGPGAGGGKTNTWKPEGPSKDPNNPGTVMLNTVTGERRVDPIEVGAKPGTVPQQQRAATADRRVTDQRQLGEQKLGIDQQRANTGADRAATADRRVTDQRQLGERGLGIQDKNADTRQQRVTDQRAADIERNETANRNADTRQTRVTDQGRQGEQKIIIDQQKANTGDRRADTAERKVQDRVASGGGTGRVPARIQIADAMVAAREEARKTNPSLPPLSREDALLRAQRAPSDKDDAALRERLASQAANQEAANARATFDRKFSRDTSIKKWREYYGLPAKPGTPAAPGITPPPANRPAPPTSSAPPAQRTTQDIAPAPRNPADRNVGTIYAAPDGRKVEWTGQGWKVIP